MLTRALKSIKTILSVVVLGRNVYRELTMCWIMFSKMFGILTDVESRGTVRASQPDTSDLIRVDITECLAMQHMFEIGCRIARVDIGRKRAWRRVAHAILVHEW